MQTLWEAICALAGEDGQAWVSLGEAVDKSAAPMKVAQVEVRRLVVDGLLEERGERLRLTERGRRTCIEVPATKEEGIIAPE